MRYLTIAFAIGILGWVGSRAVGAVSSGDSHFTTATVALKDTSGKGVGHASQTSPGGDSGDRLASGVIVR